VYRPPAFVELWSDDGQMPYKSSDKVPSRSEKGSSPPRSADHHRLAGTDAFLDFSPFAVAVDRPVRPFHWPSIKERIALIVHTCSSARFNVLTVSLRRAETRVAKLVLVRIRVRQTQSHSQIFDWRKPSNSSRLTLVRAMRAETIALHVVSKPLLGRSMGVEGG
jgi:hypothetical protein